MIRKLLLVAAWFPLTLILVLINLSMLVRYASAAPGTDRLSAIAPHDTAFQLAAPGTAQVLSANVVSADARVYLVEAFLKDHKSPMSPYAKHIVTEADRNGLDFRLIPAIAMCESNAGKHMPMKREFNFAGIAVYTGQNYGKAFDSWEHAITWVSEYIKERYYDKGVTDLKDIGAIWAPPSVAAGHSWSNCVDSFQNEII
jgi:hypothetical protein